MIIAIIPAHNEEAGIISTVDSLRNQLVPPDKIIVVADNCTDKTVEIAKSQNLVVFESVRNVYKKAGALNQVINQILPDLSDDDYLLIVDADSILCKTWTYDALILFKPEMGALSGAYVARNGRGLISILQQIEYTQERRKIARSGGHINILSGVAVFIPVRVIKQLLHARGYVYDVNSLTEDFELTLAIRQLGYCPRSFKKLRVITDVMETWGDLYRQRLRWQRGTIETLKSYGWSKFTKKLWLTQVLTYGSTLVTLLVLVSWLGVTTFQFSWFWLGLLPIFMLEQVVTSWRAGGRARFLAVLLIPMWLYEIFRSVVYYDALSKSIRRSVSVW